MTAPSEKDLAPHLKRASGGTVGGLPFGPLSAAVAEASADPLECDARPPGRAEPVYRLPPSISSFGIGVDGSSSPAAAAAGGCRRTERGCREFAPAAGGLPFGCPLERELVRAAVELVWVVSVSSASAGAGAGWLPVLGMREEVGTVAASGRPAAAANGDQRSWRWLMSWNTGGAVTSFKTSFTKYLFCKTLQRGALGKRRRGGTAAGYTMLFT